MHMSETTKNERLVYWIQTREHALRSASALAFFLGAAVIGLIAHYKAIRVISLIFGSFSALSLLLNGLAHVRHGKHLAKGDDPETWDDPDYLEYVNEPDMVVRHIDLSADGLIAFCYPQEMPEDCQICAERVYEKISVDVDEFLSDFARFKEASARRYPKYAALISGLKIGGIDVFDTKKGECVVSVTFKQGLGEIWGAEIEDAGFSELIWR